MKMKFAMVLLLFLVLNIYFGWHGSLFLESIGAMPPAPVYWAVFFLVAFSYIFGRMKQLPEAIRKSLKVIGSYYFAVFEFALLLLPLADIAAVILYSAGIRSSDVILLLGSIVIAALAVLLLRGSWNAWMPIVRSYELTIPKSAGSLQQLKVTVASDIHLGDVVGKRHLQKLIDHTKAAKPDLILLPGDVIDDDITPFIRHNMADIMKQLQAPLGVFAVLGNHEYYGGHIEEYVKRMRDVNIRVLRDETALVNDAFYVAGRKDKTAEAFEPKTKRKPVSELLADLDLTRPILLLDHQPYAFEQAAASGADVLLSGHTHRGQFFPNHWITRRMFELDWGYMKKNQMHVVVSSGFGTWGPPIRLFSRSEIIELNIRFQPPTL